MGLVEALVIGGPDGRRCPGPGGGASSCWCVSPPLALSLAEALVAAAAQLVIALAPALFEVLLVEGLVQLAVATSPR